jgi:hypothetical protein
MGGVPKPSEEEIAAIKKVSSYGKKFDQYNRGTTLGYFYYVVRIDFEFIATDGLVTIKVVFF